MFDGRYQPQLSVEGWDEKEGEEGRAGSVDQHGEQSLQSMKRESQLRSPHSIPKDFILFQQTTFHSN